ncbi:MAG TPA: ammonium transporter [Cyanobacteria bacterium UBA11162]|nr:ammonium transporter [Cyanobacteria bacterium UBA11162]
MMYKPKRKRFKRKKSWLSPSWRTCLPMTVMILLMWSYAAVAQDLSNADLKRWLDTVWVVMTGVLVFFMNAGFAMLETGFCRQKNAVNILSKNLIVFALSTVAFWAIGFSLMFSNGGFLDPIMGGLKGFFFSGREADYKNVFTSLDWANVPLSAKFFFQLVFAGTAATIVSGAVAERIKFLAFFIFSLFLVGIAYPITGHWIWGGGWLQKVGFYDFAGSTVVHCVGGWAALIGAIILGPRTGKYQGGESFAIAGHNLSISTLGCFILWLGWFGFNPGSTLSADPEAITHIVLTTNMAAATGAVAATVFSWRYFGKPDLTMTINGVLAGLVGITASCAFVSVRSAAVIGVVAGILVVLFVEAFDRWKVDDPVGAISVHLGCGLWGTLAVGLFSAGPGDLYKKDLGPDKGLLLGGGIGQFFAQLVGILAVAGFTVLLSWIAWTVIKMALGGIRVSPEEEIEGLDIGEHGMPAYSGFEIKRDLS